MTDFPTFAEFYESVHGFAPFPWQDRLASQVAESGTWPSDIGVPTGLGKTSSLDIAVWSLAWDLHTNGAQRRVPVRIWYVVNRRLLVDAAYERSLELQKELATEESGPIKVVADALRAGRAVPWDVGPLHVARLRGGAERGYRPPDPSCPSIILATVAMYGSRLLFRGYGSSIGSRPIDAALAGTDALVLLDEAHLAMPVQKVLYQLQDFPAPIHQPLPPGRQSPVVVNLSATGADDPEFTISAEDEAHPIVQTRLRAAKPTQLESVADNQIPAAMACAAVASAVAIASSGQVPATVLFVNTVRRAPQVREALEKELKKSTFESYQVRTVTGRIRPFDATRLRDELLGGDLDVSARSSVSERVEPLFVVATQTLEVGADLDFDCLVTESAGSRALVQRFGRLNRLGVRPWAQAHIIHAEGLKQWPVYGTEPLEVWDRLLLELGLDPARQTLDLGPSTIGPLLGSPSDEPPRSPELLPNHLREWAKTSVPRGVEVAPVDSFVLGEEEAARSVTVLWRSALPNSEADDHLQLRPLVHADESVEVPIWEVREFLNERRPWRLRADSGELELIDADDLGVGDTIVFDSSWGGHRPNGGWTPASTERVDDISAMVRHEIVLTGARVRDLLAAVVIDIGERDVDELAVAADARQAAWSNNTWAPAAREEAEPAEWDDAWLGNGVTSRRTRGGPVIVSLPGPASSVIPPRVEDDDELSTVSSIDESRSTLNAHLTLVGRTAGDIARAIGLPASLVDTVELAGRVHDAGKADPRFQLLLGARGDEKLAKSIAGRDYEPVRLWPKYGRHEASSGALFGRWIAEHGAPAEVDIDLAWHLILSHHGYGRPLVPATQGSSVMVTTWAIEGTEITDRVDLDQPDWQQPSRFERLNTKYGYWGLALLEAVLRQADQAESARASDEQVHLMEVH